MPDRFDRPHQASVLRRTAYRAVLTAAGVTLTMAWAGCQSARPKASEDALARYEAHDYQAAMRLAKASHGRTAGAKQEEAAFIVGMSAYELKRYDEAEVWLRPLTRSTDKAIAGRASATLGLIAASQGVYTTAALDLMAAGRKLEGDEGARAMLMAGDCYRLVGRLDAATSAYALGKGMAQSAKLKETLASRQENSAYTVQFGAFSSYGNATRALEGARMRAAAQGLPAPTIVSSTDVTGRTLYLVQAGKYPTKDQAAAARVRLGGELVVVPVELE
mgnify:CR=1 FL=1